MQSSQEQSVIPSHSTEDKVNCVQMENGSFTVRKWT